ncbi:telomerase Cajal body protein 1 isoform X2 [Nilaparvata lugens]|uniref:telomerase Cajal body protein 1 isoform X2 n=1 Tax=Nilaparvata lugens TaxID=108931 RepID=UPI00193D255F|nr:telomerase Cajal body protein 1 isoform X2 [Nilaparvata lugens]
MEVEVNNKLELDTMQIINDIVEDIIQPVLESNSKESFLKSSELSAEYKFKSFPLITKDSRSYKFQHNKEQYLKGCKCFLTTASEEPVHLWDAFTGELRASYRSYNYADEIWNAYSVTFNSSGERLYCGFKDSIRIFDTAIPGKKSTLIKIKEVTGQLGIVSCIAFNPSSTDYAVGTYAKEIGVYSEKSGTGTCVFQGHGGGITHLIFSPDGNRLYSGSRRDSEIVCWDVRNPGAVLFSMLRSVNTQQRIYFDLTPDGSSLVTGNTDGRVCIFDVTGAVSNPDTPFETQLYFNAHKDCCNGVSINPVCPVLATTSGQRHIPQVMSDSDDSEDDFQPVGDEGDIFVKDSTKTNIKKLFNYNYLKRNIEDCVKLWWVGDTVITGTDV